MVEGTCVCGQYEISLTVPPLECSKRGIPGIWSMKGRYRRHGSCCLRRIIGMERFWRE